MCVCTQHMQHLLISRAPLQNPGCGFECNSEVTCTLRKVSKWTLGFDWLLVLFMPPIHLSCSTHLHLLPLLLQLVNEEIDHQLHQARVENDKLSNLMGEMGISPRPTVAQWLQQKREQKKASMQEALISWDRWATVVL